MALIDCSAAFLRSSRSSLMSWLIERSIATIELDGLGLPTGLVLRAVTALGSRICGDCGTDAIVSVGWAGRGGSQQGKLDGRSKPPARAGAVVELSSLHRDWHSGFMAGLGSAWRRQRGRRHQLTSLLGNRALCRRMRGFGRKAPSCVAEVPVCIDPLSNHDVIWNERRRW